MVALTPTCLLVSRFASQLKVASAVLAAGLSLKEKYTCNVLVIIIRDKGISVTLTNSLKVFLFQLEEFLNFSFPR